MAANEYAAIIIRRLQEVLKPRSFRRKGQTFIKAENDVLLLVNLQRSDSSTKNLLKVTVNLGVYSKPLGERLRGRTDTGSVWDCHWTRRIGSLMPEVRWDLWWRIETDAEAERAADEIARAVEQHGLPAIGSLASTEALAALWRSGQSPGLTAIQRQRHLDELDAGARG